MILIRAPDAAGGQHHGLRRPDDEVALLAVVAERAGDAARVHQQRQHRAFHVHFHAGVDAVVLQRADHLEARAIAHVRQPRIAMAAEVPLQDPAVLRAVEHRAPGFQFVHAVRRFLGVQFGHAPVVQILPAAHGIGEVDAPVIAVVHIGQRRGHAAFGHHRVRFAEQRLANDADLHARSPPLQSPRADPLRPRRSPEHRTRASGIRPLQNSPVRPDSHGAQTHIDIRESDRDKARPGPVLVLAVEAAHAVVKLEPHRMLRDAVDARRPRGGGTRGIRRCSPPAERRSRRE